MGGGIQSTSKRRHKRRKQQVQTMVAGCCVGPLCLHTLYPCWILISTFMLVPAFPIAEGSISKGLAIVLMRYTWSEILFKPPSVLHHYSHSFEFNTHEIPTF